MSPLPHPQKSVDLVRAPSQPMPILIIRLMVVDLVQALTLLRMFNRFQVQELVLDPTPRHIFQLPPI